MGKPRALVVNLVGAPGAGKSTGAAYIFAQLKMAGVNAELITEFAKDKCFEESKEVFKNQVYLFGKQYFRISRVADKVDVIVTDSPLLQSCAYNPYEGDVREAFENLVISVYLSHRNLTYYVKRVKPYNPVGRFQSESESDDKGSEIKAFLEDKDIVFEEITGCEKDYDEVVKFILETVSTRVPGTK